MVAVRTPSVAASTSPAALRLAPRRRAGSGSPSTGCSTRPAQRAEPAPLALPTAWSLPADTDHGHGHGQDRTMTTAKASQSYVATQTSKITGMTAAAAAWGG